MRLTIPEQAIIKCICNAREPANRQHIITQTSLGQPTVDKCLGSLVVTNQLVLLPGGGFGLTKLVKCNPVVILMMQEIVEERLWTAGGVAPHRKLVQRFVDGITAIIDYRLLFSRKNIQ